jgi:hypothetical protein
MRNSTINILVFFLLFLSLKVNAQTFIHPYAQLNPNINGITDNYAIDMATDGSGNLFITRAYGNITKISSSGIVTEEWAFVGAANTKIVRSSTGVIYTTSDNSTSVCKITGNGLVTQIWAILNPNAYPIDIAIDAYGNVFTLNNNNTISKIYSDGLVNQVWATTLTESYSSIAIDASGNVYTTYDNQIRKFVPNGNGGTFSNKWDVFGISYIDIVVDRSRNVYALVENFCVSKLSSSGVLTTLWAEFSTSDYRPKFIALDAPGNVYTLNAVGAFGLGVSKITPSRSNTENWCNIPYSPRYQPKRMVIDASGNIYILHPYEISKISVGSVTAINSNPNIPSSNIANIFPNPTSNIINIEGLNKNENYTMQIFDVQGKLVITKTINEKETIDISELNKGVYVIKIGEDAQRIVKM